MAVYFSIEDRGNKNGDHMIRISWHHKGQRLQTTTGITTNNKIKRNRVEGSKRNVKNLTSEEINFMLDKIEKFLCACEAYAMKIGVSLMTGTMRGLFKEFKTSNFTNDLEVMMKWITTSPSNGLYWQKYDDCCYKKLCEATDSSDSTTKYVIYQELFGRSRIFSMPIEEFYGTVEYQGKIFKRFVEIDQEIALYQLP